MLNRQTISALSDMRADALISFYIPTHRVAGIEEDRIRYKNMLAQVNEVLLARGFDQPTVDRRLADAHTKLQEETFWQQQSDCLAVFIGENDTHYHSLPLDLEELYFVGEKFYVLPLLPFAQEKNPFYLLALSQDEVKVYEGSRYTMAELEKNDDFPESLKQVLATYDSDQNLQHHNANSTVYHGQGAGKDVENARYREYLRQVDAGIQTMACDDDQTPLLLYTTPELAGVYRKVNTYPKLQQEFINGNPEEEDLGMLHERAWEILEAHYATADDSLQDTFDQHLAEETASYNVHEIGPAAMGGRVDQLFLVKNKECWGTYDAQTHKMELHEERQESSQPLYHDIALATWQQGGEVALSERDGLPRSESNINAIFRYAMSPA